MGCKAAIPTDEYHGWECEIKEERVCFYTQTVKDVPKNTAKDQMQ